MTLEIVKVAGPRPIAPRTNAFTERFWNALAAGRFETTRCLDCRRMSFPPKPHCPACGSRSVEWAEIGTRGRLYSATVVHQSAPAFGAKPFTAAIVDLESGVRLVTRLIDAVPLDAPVELVVLAFDDGPLFGAKSVK